MEPLTDDSAISDDHRTNQRIRADTASPALGKGERALQEVVIGG
jgi:hypothetical protein